jgi:hypothetical protein
VQAVELGVGCVWYKVFAPTVNANPLRPTPNYYYHCSSVTKTVAVSGALVLTTILGHTFFNAPLDSNIILGCLVTIVSIFTYRYRHHRKEPTTHSQNIY